MTKDYIGTKIITAWRDTRDGKEGYAVKYADGYTSWSPKETFEEAYRAIQGDGQALSFGDALVMLKAGKKVARSGWNGKGMFLIHVPGSDSVMPREGTPYADLKVSPDGVVTINGHIDMKTATGEMQPGWLASQTDMLATDWQVIE